MGQKSPNYLEIVVAEFKNPGDSLMNRLVFFLTTALMYFFENANEVI